MPDLNEKADFIYRMGGIGNQADCPVPLRHQANVVAFFGILHSSDYTFCNTHRVGRVSDSVTRQIEVSVSGYG